MQKGTCLGDLSAPVSSLGELEDQISMWQCQRQPKEKNMSGVWLWPSMDPSSGGGAWCPGEIPGGEPKQLWVGFSTTTK